MTEYSSDDPENDFFPNSYVSSVYNQEWFRPYFVNGEIVVEADLLAQIAKKN